MHSERHNSLPQIGCKQKSSEMSARRQLHDWKGRRASDLLARHERKSFPRFTMNEPQKKTSGETIIKWVALCLFIGLLTAAIAAPHFVRARAVISANACMNYLHEIDAAKNERALKNGKKTEDACTEADIRPYVKLDANGNFPRCPDGGVYTIGKIDENPTCSLGKTNPLHVLP